MTVPYSQRRRTFKAGGGNIFSLCMRGRQRWHLKAIIVISVLQTLVQCSVYASHEPKVTSMAQVYAKRTVETTTNWFQNKTYVNITGDFVLGALFPIHRRGSALDVCGRIQPDDGIQPLEAMLYTLNEINKRSDLLPGIQLGVLALDTCDSSTYALEQSLDFIKGFIAHINEYHAAEFQCADGSPAKFREGKFDRLVGVIGGQSSSVSIQVATLLRLFQIPQISYMSTSPQLSNRERFPYFFRTVPSDVNQAHAILDILHHFNWTYVAVIYSDSEYGVHCFETLKDVADNDSICFTPPQRVIRDQFTEQDYDQIIRAIASKKEIRVIVLILEKEYVVKLMMSARNLNVGSRYVWLGTDAWSNRDSINMGSIVEGAIAIQPYANLIRGFDTYFTSLTLEHKAVNPWFTEFWEQTFECRVQGSPPTKYNEKFSSTCERNSTLRGENHSGVYRQQTFLHFIRDAVYAFAYALNNLHKEKCNGKPGVCSDMAHVDGIHIVEYLKNVSFADIDEESTIFKFESEGDGPTRYTIVNFQKDVSTGHYSWVEVGNYSSHEDRPRELKLDHFKLRYRTDEGSEFPASSCTPLCASHEVKVRERDDSCCWKCRPCGTYQVKHGDFHCDECKPDFSPDPNHSKCIPIPEKYVDYGNAWAIGAMGFAGLGILTTTFVTIVFWAYNETPIVKAAGRELSYTLLLGIFLSFSVTFVIVAEPTPFTCGLMRFFVGFCQTLCYAAIVTKTNRIARIFHQKQGMSAPKTKYISPASQMIIVCLLTAVEVAINVVWIIWDPPRTTHFLNSQRTVRIRICAGVESYSYIVGIIYPVILIGFCTIYAIQTRKCPGGFNETKYIAFTNYTIIIIWLAFVPLYIASTSNSIRVVTLAISLSLSGFVELGCLFFPKLYIVLFKPEKNTKEVVMAPNRSSFATLSTTQNPLNPSHNGGFHTTPENDTIRPNSALAAQETDTSARSVSRSASEASC